MKGADPIFAAALTRLQADPESLPAGERRDLATHLGRAWATSAATEESLTLATLLAQDPLPEVRKEVAEALVSLPEEPFTKLAARLGTDDNAFVAKAVERVIARRRRSGQQTQRTCRNLGVVEGRLASFAETHGPVAMQEARRIAEELFSILVQQTHHDLGNILSPIKTGLTRLLRQAEGGGNPCSQAEVLQEMARRLEYLERFLGDMKEYAKAGAVERRRERLVEVVREAQAVAVDGLTQAGVGIEKIQVTIDVPAPLTVCVARYQVLLALVHVIKNAYEALLGSPGRQAESLLTIGATEATAGAVVLTIQDNANGIHPEDLDTLRAFAPGRRSQKPNGTGFGLPTAARYVAAQGGVLQLDSLPGEGTTVTFTLPTSCEDEET